jgi:hypothetical protein
MMKPFQGFLARKSECGMEEVDCWELMVDRRHRDGSFSVARRITTKWVRRAAENKNRAWGTVLPRVANAFDGTRWKRSDLGWYDEALLGLFGEL